MKEGSAISTLGSVTNPGTASPEAATATCWPVAARTLRDAGCEVVIGLPADEPGLLDAAASTDGLTAVPVRDQRVGACAAVAAAMLTRRPVVLALTTGPAFTNALTGLLEGMSLGAPVIVVTVRIAANEIGRGGFQETDHRSLAQSVVKDHLVVATGDTLQWALRRAAHLAVNGKPGPVLVEISAETATSTDAVACAPYAAPVRALRSHPDPADVAEALAVMAQARRPLVLAGGGVRAADAAASLRMLATEWGAATATTASGRGTFDELDPHCFGLVGLYATPPLTTALADVDVVLAIGTALEETVRMGWDLDRVRLIHADVDASTFHRAVPAEITLLGDARLTTEALRAAWARQGDDIAGQDGRTGWRRTVAAARRALDADAKAVTFAESPTRAVLRVLPDLFPDAVLVQENGLHDIWGYHISALTLPADFPIVGPGEQTMMGFGLPAAVGVAATRPGRPVVLVCGDGAFAMSANTLPTAAELGCPLVMVVFDNNGFGWPRFLRRQDGHPSAQVDFRTCLPMAALVEAIGGITATVTDEESLRSVMERARTAVDAGRPALVVVPVDDDDVPVGIRRIFGMEGAESC
ncbi:thiamine pyrophosphate-binding protein [Streptomyces guryensis]|uniref:Thiamine pyrophosphate-binding protein n=1 Tax=Streptomyces guryensis TaxID=2886947 RepID=A0A9Q3VXE5_9ACTN|nr:thiamine pyrophosphate-binding protein [Streptomyces guryensis]MCD9880201.1 thiamine pyrophosphate-binding protein [Streptomyces guryensis]